MRLTRKSIGFGIVFALIIFIIITVRMQFNREYDDFLTYKRALVKVSEFVVSENFKYPTFEENEKYISNIIKIKVLRKCDKRILVFSSKFLVKDENILSRILFRSNTNLRRYNDNNIVNLEDQLILESFKSERDNLIKKNKKINQKEKKWKKELVSWCRETSLSSYINSVNNRKNAK